MEGRDIQTADTAHQSNLVSTERNVKRRGKSRGKFQDEESQVDPKWFSEDFFKVLDEHRRNCEREGKLEEAAQARRRLKELRILEEQRRT